MNLEQYFYLFRYWLAQKVMALNTYLFKLAIKLENKNYWNEYNENFRS